MSVDLRNNGSDQVTAAEVRAIQAEVFALAVDERIDADGALMVFLSLSNQILAEVQQDNCEK